MASLQKRRVALWRPTGGAGNDAARPREPRSTEMIHFREKAAVLAYPHIAGQWRPSRRRKNGSEK